jgi:hypothetical protein
VKGSVQVQLDALVMQRKVGKWTLVHCINCDNYVFATGNESMLVNKNLTVSQCARCDATIIDSFPLLP